MNISDPHDFLNGDGQTVFTFPYVAIESVLILDPLHVARHQRQQLSGHGGRDTNSDHTEFLNIRLDQRLDVARDCHGDDDDGDHEGSRPLETSRLRRRPAAPSAAAGRTRSGETWAP